jgi:inner membrane protein involved in colicin E2 resistance
MSKLLLPQESSLQVGGVFDVFVNGEHVETCKNLVTTEGLNHILDIALSGGTQISAWKVTAYKNNVSPAANWTSANFNSTAAEITASDVTSATRVAWVDAGVAAGVVDNYASKAEYTVSAATLDLYGVAFVSGTAFGGTGDVLVAASAFGAVRNLLQNDVIGFGYRFTATSS